MTNQTSIELQISRKPEHWKLSSCQCAYVNHFEHDIFAIDIGQQRKEQSDIIK